MSHNRVKRSNLTLLTDGKKADAAAVSVACIEDIPMVSGYVFKISEPESDASFPTRGRT